jgi:hypothetical protein
MRKHATVDTLQFKLHHKTCTLGGNIARDESPQTLPHSPRLISL